MKYANLILLFACGACDPTFDPEALAVVDRRPITRAAVVRHLRATDDLSPEKLAVGLEEVIVEAQQAAAARAERLNEAPEVRLELEGAEMRILARAYRRSAQVAPDGDAVEARVDLLREEATEPELDLRMIKVRVRPSADPERGRLEAQAKAQGAYSRLRAGEPFAVVAADVSDDKRSGANGGSLGWVRKQQVDSELFDAVSALQPGTPTAPIQRPDGLFILQADSPPRDHSPLRPTLEGRVRAELQAEARQTLREAVGKRFPATLLSAPRGTP